MTGGGLPGRPPEPLELRMLKGNRQKRAIPASPTPAPLDQPPDPPASLGPDGLEAWQNYWHGAGSWLSESDVPAVRRLCSLLDQVARLDLDITKARSQNKRIYLMNCQRGLYRDILALEDRYGLNPSSRSRIRIEKPADDPGDAWLRNRPKRTG